MGDVRIYVKQGCRYSKAAKDLLRRREVPFEEIDITGDEALRREMVERSGGHATTPEIFLDGRHVGGFTELAALDREGKLAPYSDVEPVTPGAHP